MSHAPQDPGHGNLSEIHGFSNNQASRDSGAQSASSRLSAIVNSSEAQGWSAGAAVAWHERLARIFPTLDGAAQLAHNWSGAASSYRNTLESLSAQATAANHKIHNAYSMINAFSHVPAEVAQTPQMQAKISNYEDDIQEGQSALWNLQMQRDHIDAACANGLSIQAGLGENRNWSALQALYGDAKSVDDIRETREELVDRYSELGDKAVNSSASIEELDELARFLATTGSDPALAAKFWENYSGAEATWMLDNGVSDRVSLTGGDFNDPEAAAAAVAYAQGLRDSLSAASVTWDQSTAETFAAEMWTGQSPPIDGLMTPALAELAYLFDDAGGSPMAVRFTVAMADLIDSHERGANEYGYLQGQAVSGLGADGLTVAGGNSSAMMQMWGAEGRGDSDLGLVSISDPLSRVMDTLALYPEQAWDWLSSTDTTLPNGGTPGPGAANRVDYYAQRDWAADGFDGFGALWEGSMHADGGLASESFSSSTWNDMCDASSRIVAGIDQGGHLDAGSLSDGGATNLGNAVAQLIPFVEYQGWSTPDVPGAGDSQVVTTEGAFLASGHPGTIAFLDPAVFGDLVTTLVSNDNGFVPIRQAVTQVQTELLYNADQRGTYEAWDDALSRVASLEASLEGAMGGADILQARLQDDSIRLQMSIAQLPLNFLPSAGVGVFVDAVIGESAGIGIDAFTEHFLATNEGMANAQLDYSQLAGAAGIEHIIASLDGDPTCSLSSVQPAEKSRDEWFGTFVSDQDHGYYSSVWHATDDV